MLVRQTHNFGAPREHEFERKWAGAEDLRYTDTRVDEQKRKLGIKFERKWAGAEDLRYTDTRVDEQKRKLGIKV
ncbi:hypothetical protein T484DRAFT_1817741 [Baffinella frigidus]|nr:hypothetical protein T484DRAFT_1817741 [Cryptophyta sp. CCMP2293]